MLVAEADATPVGFGCAIGAHDSQWGTLLDNLHVLADRQGSGIGRGLVRRIAQWTSSRYPDGGLYLWVLEQNTAAREFYRRMGGRDVGGELWTPPGGGRVTRQRYAWTPSELLTLLER